MTNPNETDFFDNVGGGAGAPSAVLKNVGDTVAGEIVEMFKRDYIPFGKDESERDDKGNAVQQLVIVLQTENRNWANVAKIPKVDPTDPNSADKAPSEDDGKRAVYVPERKNLQYAIAKACQEAKAKPAVGGTLAVRIFNLKDTGKGNPLKEHQARYTPPNAGGSFFDGVPSQAPQAQQAPAQAAPPQQQPVAQQAPAQQSSGGDPWASAAPAPAQGDPWATPGGSSAPPF